MRALIYETNFTLPDWWISFDKRRSEMKTKQKRSENVSTLPRFLTVDERKVSETKALP